MMYVMFVLMATGGLLVTANAGPIAKTWGLSTLALTWATTLSPLANGASRVFWGWASDRIGREMAMIVAFTLQAVCLALVVVLGPTSPFWFSTTLVLVYFTWGEIYSLFPSASADYFGARHATSNYAVLYTAKGVATAIGALGLGAFLYERTGSWATGFYISAVMALVAAVTGSRTSRIAGHGESQGREDPRAGVIARFGVLTLPGSCRRVSPPSRAKSARSRPRRQKHV